MEMKASLYKSCHGPAIASVKLVCSLTFTSSILSLRSVTVQSFFYLSIRYRLNGTGLPINFHSFTK
jgi:hypothetical protein